MGTLLMLCAWIGGNALWDFWKHQKTQAARRARTARKCDRPQVRSVRSAGERAVARRSA